MFKIECIKTKALENYSSALIKRYEKSSGPFLISAVVKTCTLHTLNAQIEIEKKRQALTATY